jgi:hypothetical protein
MASLGQRAVGSDAGNKERLMSSDVHAQRPGLQSVVSANGAAAVLVLSALPFALYAYNSGYGYDQLEYLIIGRSLVDGFAFYDLVPSKSPGVYLLTALLMKCGLSLGHGELAAVIALVYLAMVAATFAVARRLWDGPTAAVGTSLVAAGAWFMELNFLQPTGFVYLFGLLAYACCLQAIERAPFARRWWFACGALVAIGMQFKSVAAFYGVAAFLLVVATSRRSSLLWNAGALLLGAIAPTLAVLAYFWITGRAGDFWTWTIIFPLFKYPSNTVFLSKLYTKLLVFVVVFAAALIGSCMPRYRRVIWHELPTCAAFVFGAVSLAALLKTQASHYCFPAAAFLSLFSARVITRAAADVVGRKNKLLLVGAGAAAVILTGVSVALYRPDALLRLTALRTFQEEHALVEYIDKHTTAAQRILVFSGSTFAYWVSHRYPILPLVNTDVQSTYYFELHDQALIRALEDPALRLVEFDSEHQTFDDPAFLDSTRVQIQISQFRTALAQAFVVDRSAPPGLTFWIRKD